MKILQIASNRSVNGAQMHVALLCRELKKRGHDVHLLGRKGSWLWTKLQDLGISSRISELTRLPPGELLQVARWVKEEGFDVMHTHQSRAHFFGVLLRRLTGVPVVATAHATKFQPHWYFNDLVIANSESTRRYHVRYNRVPQRKAVTIPCFIDTDRFIETDNATRQWARQELGIQDDRPVIGIVAQVTERKGQLEFVKALPELVHRFPDVTVVFLGKSSRGIKYGQRVHSQLLRDKNEDRVIWAGCRNNVHRWIQAFDAVVVPSLREPLGLCALEAMAAGIPVAASHRDGLKEFVIPEQTGLLFDPRKPQDIAAKTSRILTDQQLRCRLTKKAREMVIKDFSPETLTQKIESALGSVVSGKVTKKAA